MIKTKLLSTPDTKENVLHYESLFAVLIFCMGLWMIFSAALLTGNELPDSLRQNIALLNLPLVAGLIIALRLRSLKVLVAGLLPALAITGGIAMSLWVVPSDRVFTALLVSVGIIFLILMSLWLTSVSFEKHNGLLTVLAITFSLVGILLIYNQISPFFMIIWSGAAALCFVLLLHNVLSNICFKSQSAQILQGTTGLFLLWSGLLANLLLMTL